VEWLNESIPTDATQIMCELFTKEEKASSYVSSECVDRIDGTEA
jgi:hypothetical protein